MSKRRGSSCYPISTRELKAWHPGLGRCEGCDIRPAEKVVFAKANREYFLTYRAEVCSGCFFSLENGLYCRCGKPAIGQGRTEHTSFARVENLCAGCICSSVEDSYF